MNHHRISRFVARRLRQASDERGLALVVALLVMCLLTALGIDARATALARAAPDRAASIAADRERLTGAMGDLFKALAITAPAWPNPAGFA